MPELTFPIRRDDLTNRNPIGCLNDYSILQPVGKGHLFPVYLALDPSDNKLVVLKIMDPTEASFMNEVSVFKASTHKNIVRCKSFVENGQFTMNETFLTYKDKMNISTPAKKTDSISLTKNALVIELAPYGDLFNYVLHGPLSEGITRYYMGQIIEAIEHLHENGYCHADIKLENVLLDENFDIKLTDFGFSCNIFENKVIEKRTGTPSYRPPEMWAEDYKGHNGIQTDIFQLGVVLFILQTGMRPFHEANQTDCYYKAAIAGRWDLFWMFKQRDFKVKKLAMLSDDLKELLAQMLSPKLEDRPSLQKIKNSTWFLNTQSANSEEVALEMKRRAELMK